MFTWRDINRMALLQNIPPMEFMFYMNYLKHKSQVSVEELDDPLKLLGSYNGTEVQCEDVEGIHLGLTCPLEGIIPRNRGMFA